jgi:hypothetical protein
LQRDAQSEYMAAFSHQHSLHRTTGSVQLLGRVSTSRCLLWAILAFSSMPLYLVYNSAIFSSVGVTEYSFAVVDDTFFADRSLWHNGPCLSNYAIEPFLSEEALDWDNLTAKECIQTYGTDFLTTDRNVLVVVDPNSVQLDDTEE